jgi:hypothetical protein
MYLLRLCCFFTFLNLPRCEVTGVELAKRSSSKGKSNSWYSAANVSAEESLYVVEARAFEMVEFIAGFGRLGISDVTSSLSEASTSHDV